MKAQKKPFTAQARKYFHTSSRSNASRPISIAPKCQVPSRGFTSRRSSHST